MLTLTYGGPTRGHAELQRHGRRQGGARGVRSALPGRRLRPAAASAPTRSRPGPVRTLAGAGISDARSMLPSSGANSPLRKTVTHRARSAARRSTTSLDLSERRHRRHPLRRPRLQHHLDAGAGKPASRRQRQRLTGGTRWGLAAVPLFARKEGARWSWSQYDGRRTRWRLGLQGRRRGCRRPSGRMMLR